MREAALKPDCRLESQPTLSTQHVSRQTLRAGNVASYIAKSRITTNIIDNTARGEFLTSPGIDEVIMGRAAYIYEAAGMPADAASNAAQTFLYGNVRGQPINIAEQAQSLWGQASETFASSLTGDITVLGTVAQTNPTGVLTQIEMPQVLSNLGPNGVTSVDGIAASTQWKSNKRS